MGSNPIRNFFQSFQLILLLSFKIPYITHCGQLILTKPKVTVFLLQFICFISLSFQNVLFMCNKGDFCVKNKDGVRKSDFIIDFASSLVLGGAVRGFRVKRDRPNLFSVIRNQKKIKFVNRE